MSALCWHFACLQMSTLCKFVSLMEHYQCFPSKDIRPRECIKKYCPLGGISQYTPKGAGMSCHSISSLLPVNIKKYIPSVSNIKINTKMMREWPIFKQAHLWVHVKNLVVSSEGALYVILPYDYPAAPTF